MASAADQANQRMVDRLIAEGALWSKPLIAAFRATPRHRFLDRIFQYQRKHSHWREILTSEPGPAELRLIYADRALITHISPPGRNRACMPISSSSQPSLMSQMLEDLRLGQGLKVLEIGAGTGYDAALLAHLVGPDLVLSIDVDRGVLSEAWDHLRAFPERKVHLQHADGRAGYVEEAPYDRIMVTAATPDLEPAWLEQLAAGGLLLAPLALAPGLAFVVRGSLLDGVFDGRLIRAAYFMSLRAEGESGTASDETGQQTREIQAISAPWKGWFDRPRPRTSWLGFIQALVFYGWLRGLTVHFQNRANGESMYGVEEAGEVCWFGAHNWQVTNSGGRDLGWSLWRSFLDAGGPRPTEFRLRASPDRELPQCAGEAQTYFRQGVRCRQQWELTEPLDRPV
jgi:protein-L-isoaspartate O-methyltransferase